MKKRKPPAYYTNKKPDCCNCKYRVWLIALGLGIFCNNEKNEDKDLGFGIQGFCNQPFLPYSKPYCCEHYEGKLKSELTYCKVEDLPDLPLYPFAEEILKNKNGE